MELVQSWRLSHSGHLIELILMLNQLLFEIVDELHPDELPMFNPSWGFHPQLCHKRLFHDDVLVGFLWFILAYIAMNLHLIIIIHALWLNEKSWYNLPFVLLTFLALLQFLNSKRKNCVLLGNKFLCWSCCCCREPNHHVDFGVGWVFEFFLITVVVVGSHKKFMSKSDNCWFFYIFQKTHNNFYFFKFMIYPAKNWWIYIAFFYKKILPF
jgi:hypothetical protein